MSSAARWPTMSSYDGCRDRSEGRVGVDANALEVVGLDDGSSWDGAPRREHLLSVRGRGPCPAAEQCAKADRPDSAGDECRAAAQLGRRREGRRRGRRLAVDHPVVSRSCVRHLPPFVAVRSLLHEDLRLSDRDLH